MHHQTGWLRGGTIIRASGADVVSAAIKVAFAISAILACMAVAEVATATSPPLPVAWKSNTWRSPLGYTYSSTTAARCAA
jgi:hypothetical protein